MRRTPTLLTIASLLVVLSLGLSACSMGPGASPSPAAADRPVKLKFAALRILDSLPVYAAQQRGYFQQHGVEVEIVPVNSAPERDQLIAAGQVDGMINEVLSSILSNKDQTQIQVVRFARAATATSPLFRILTSAQSGIKSVAELKGVEVGISNATVIEYLNERLLKAEGLTAEEIKTIAVPSLSDRLSLLNSGQLKAGVLPDPLASLAMAQGAIDVLDDTRHPEYSYSTISFRKAVIDEHPEAVRGFLAAIEEAVNEINRDGSQFKTLLGEQNVIPQPLMESFVVPGFVTAGVPSEEQYADVLAWAREKGLLDTDVPYSETVNPSFLPE